MAAANESQGLKIAVAAFITLSVILSVTSYFLYSAYASADARFQSTSDELNKAKTAQSTALNQYEDMRTKIGTRATDYEPANEEIKGHIKKMDQRLNDLLNQVNAAVQKVEQAGVQGTEMAETKNKIVQTIASYRSEPNKSYISSLDRSMELMENLSLLSTEMSLNYKDLRDRLEAATSVAQQQVGVQAKAAEASRVDLAEEHKKHEEERQGLHGRVEQLTTDNDKKSTEIADLQAKSKQQADDYGREKETLTAIVREQRDKLEQKETILDHPDGYITYVDYEAREVQVNINRRMGARPQMVMSVFDAQSPGIPTEKPKGSIELTKIGEQISVARVIKTVNPIDPIRIGDIVYTPAWSPNTPMRFALIGKIDVNRDGREDREELKRMIQEAGGVVDYDLPPLEVGQESGKLTPRIDWYVIDDRVPFHEVYNPRSEPNLLLNSKLQQRMGEVIKEARLDGIRPMPIGRLLNYLGYDMNTPVVGRPENINSSAIRRLTAPKVQGEAGTKPAATTTSPESPKAEATPPAEEPSKKAEEKEKADPGEPK
jgi:hypothetical protein